jgi:hypothetical protein
VIVNACWPGSRIREEDPFWTAERSPLRERDKTLAPEALAWYQELPHPMRPLELCARYPRIANRLALVWPDAQLTHLYFRSLLVDKRGGRRGFPPRVAEELVALRGYFADLRGVGADPAREQLMAMLRKVLGKVAEETAEAQEQS